MAKSFPGRLFKNFEPALTDNGGAWVGLDDVGFCSISVTVNVATAGNHVLLHSLKVAPSFWMLRPKGGSVDAFMAWPGVTAAGASAVYYTAAWTDTFGKTQAARAAELIVFR
jgi:hypothetical protein